MKDGNVDHITREPEQVKAFRDTWRDGIHSYLTYLRDRLTVARDLLTDSGSIFVQIGDENVHRVRAVMDEVFGEDNFVSQIAIARTSGCDRMTCSAVTDYRALVSRKTSRRLKYRQLLRAKSVWRRRAAVTTIAFDDLAEQRLDSLTQASNDPERVR